MAEVGRDILVITADAVKYTGQVSFKFMIDADPERKIGDMPSKWGLVWKSDDGGHHFNVFEGGKGLVVGGGWTDSDDFDWAQQMFNGIPSCTLLMDIDLLPWWEEHTKKHSVKYRHHHFSGILHTT